MAQDYVSIPVPAHRVQEVYELLARPASVTAAAPADEETLDDTALLERAYRESPPTMKAVFDYLADRAGRKVPMSELAPGVKRKPAQMAGALGAFGRRWKNRYQRPGAWPFDAHWDYDLGMMTYSMSAEAAKVIKKVR